MTKKIILGIVVLLLLFAVGLVFSAIGTYNELVTLNEGVSSSWAQVETVLQRRFDLIPNLVNTVKGFAAQEKEVLTRVTELRSQWGEARTVAEKASVAGGLEGALSRLLLVTENYPALKSNQNFLALQDELSGTENRISVERRRYNETVRQFNTRIRQFPANLVASFGGFEEARYFEAVESAQEAPKVQF